MEGSYILMKKIYSLIPILLFSCHPVHAADYNLWGDVVIHAHEVRLDDAANMGTAPGSLATKDYVDNNSGGSTGTGHKVTTSTYTIENCQGDWYDIETVTAVALTFDTVAALEPTTCCFTSRTTGDVSIFSASTDGFYTLTSGAGTDGDGFTSSTPGLSLCFAAYDEHGLGLVPGVLPDGWADDSPVTCALTTPEETGTTASSVPVGEFAGRLYRATKFVFTGTTGTELCAINLWNHFTGSTAHTYNAQVWSHDGGGDEPDAVLGASDFRDLSGIGAIESEEQFLLTTPSSALTNGATYWIIEYSASADASHYTSWHVEADGATERRMYSADGVTWTLDDAASTYKFRIYGQ